MKKLISFVFLAGIQAYFGSVTTAKAQGFACKGTFPTASFNTSVGQQDYNDHTANITIEAKGNLVTGINEVQVGFTDNISNVVNGNTTGKFTIPGPINPMLTINGFVFKTVGAPIANGLVDPNKPLRGKVNFSLSPKDGPSSVSIKVYDATFGIFKLSLEDTNRINCVLESPNVSPTNPSVPGVPSLPMP